MADATFQEIRNILKAVSESQAETEQKFQALAQAQAKTEAQFALTEAQMAASDARFEAKLDRLSALYGGVADNLGSVAEEFFYNSLCRNPVIGDIKYDRVSPNVIAGNKGKQVEFDMVLVNGNSVALLEVKHKAQLSALDQLEKQIKRYREVFPEHANYKLYGGVAGLSVPSDTVEEAHKRGMFVLKQQGDVFAVDTEAMRAF